MNHPFPSTRLAAHRFSARLEDVWFAAKLWAQQTGKRYEHGHYQGTPAL